MTNNFLKQKMFADNTNLYYSSKEIDTISLETNLELKKITEYFPANKPSLNRN